jgi:hypothetical protein
MIFWFISLPRKSISQLLAPKVLGSFVHTHKRSCACSFQVLCTIVPVLTCLIKCVEKGKECDRLSFDIARQVQDMKYVHRSDFC